MKKFIDNLIKDFRQTNFKSFFKWVIVIYLCWLFSFYSGLSREDSWVLFFIFFFLIYLIDSYGNQINKLKRKIKFLEEKWKHVDFEACHNAMKQIEKDGKFEDIDVSEIMEN